MAVVDFIGVRPAEWVIAFYIVVCTAMVMWLGFHPLTAGVLLAMAGLTYIATLTCSGPELSYWRGLRVVASVNFTGETVLGSFIVIPMLVMGTVFSWALGLVGIAGARAWARRRWLGFVAGCYAVAARVRVRR